MGYNCFRLASWEKYTKKKKKNVLDVGKYVFMCENMFYEMKAFETRNVFFSPVNKEWSLFIQCCAFCDTKSVWFA